MPEGRFSAWFGLPDYPGIPGGSRWVAEDEAVFDNIHGKPIKIVFCITGRGNPRAVARAPTGDMITPRWGPRAHTNPCGADPGQEWGVGFVFRERGCWRFEVRREDQGGTITFRVRS